MGILSLECPLPYASRISASIAQTVKYLKSYSPQTSLFFFKEGWDSCTGSQPCLGRNVVRGDVEIRIEKGLDVTYCSELIAKSLAAGVKMQKKGIEKRRDPSGRIGAYRTYSWQSGVLLHYVLLLSCQQWVSSVVCSCAYLKTWRMLHQIPEFPRMIPGQLFTMCHPNSRTEELPQARGLWEPVETHWEPVSCQTSWPYRSFFQYSSEGFWMDWTTWTGLLFIWILPHCASTCPMKDTIPSPVQLKCLWAN